MGRTKDGRGVVVLDEAFCVYVYEPGSGLLRRRYCDSEDEAESIIDEETSGADGTK